ncbi:PREDICTED: uncharacterized protein LOC106549677 [Thamnophis sirtalis]|uniref:Uncharacterized protein LOC106549677 n=1 Tax=Thamnophis sirtalis TaxID=35019 RepID=A0A6I9YF68_9SAUR|nr:PREDICTED: uncharacterized protein LOC106549677 [Thamnophis sirtalis]
MSSREDTQRAVAILARYRGILQFPAEQPLRASIEKVTRIFQSELFQALLDIQECYKLSVLPACQQNGSAGLGPGGPSKSQDVADPGGQEGHPLQGRATGAVEAEPVPQLVRVTQGRMEMPAQVCSLVVVGVSGVLPKVNQTGSDVYLESGSKTQEQIPVDIYAMTKVVDETFTSEFLFLCSNAEIHLQLNIPWIFQNLLVN